MNISWRNWDCTLTVVFAIWLGIAGLIYLLCDSCDSWLRSLTAIGTWFIAIGIFFAFWQYLQMRRSTNAQLAIGLLQELQRQDRVETLRYIYSFDNPISHEDVEMVLSEQHRTHIDMVLNQLDMLGILVKNRVMDERLAIDGYAGGTVLRCWYQLHLYIRGEEEGKRGSNVYEHLEYLVSRTLKYAKSQHKPKYWISFRPGAKGKRIDLVATLTETKDPKLEPKRL